MSVNLQQAAFLRRFDILLVMADTNRDHDPHDNVAGRSGSEVAERDEGASSTAGVDDASGRPQGRGRSGRRLRFWFGYALFLLVLAELGARVFWVTRGVPMIATGRYIYRSFYPSVARVERSPDDSDEECFDVLLLGASALHLDYGDIEHLLQERLTRSMGSCVRVHNVSEPGHTTLDSLYKYKHLEGRAFDLVLVYHGINEVRANNCTSERFRPDYDHFAWYQLINSYERNASGRFLVAPYTIKFVAMKIAGRLGWTDTLPMHRPSESSMALGCDVKTVESFRANLQGIIDLAGKRGERVVLATFAYYIPDGYDEAKFDARSLDYTTHLFPIELWGRPDCVAKVLDAHNRVIVELAQQSDNVLLVDQNALIPKNAEHFNDVCHLTHEGCLSFVQNILTGLEAWPKER